MMKRKILVMIAILFFTGFSSVFQTVQGQEKLDYEKYGRIAIAVVKADYLSDEVIEYEYLGRSKTDEANRVVDSFRFEVKEDNKDFFVIVKVTHHLKENKLLELTTEVERK